MPSPARMPQWLETAWLERYLERRLSAEESEWFEAYAIAEPSLVLSIERDNDLRDGLAHAGSEVIPELRSVRSHPSGASWLPVALAASLSAGIALGLFLDRDSPAGVSAEQQTISVPTRVVFEAFRGTRDTPAVHRGVSNEHLLVQVGLPYDARNVRVSDGSREIAVASHDSVAYFLWSLHPDAGDAAHLTLTYDDHDGTTHTIPLPLGSAMQENVK